MSDILGTGFNEYLRAVVERDEQAAAFYAMLKKRGQLKSHVVVTYRCAAHRCMLAQILTSNVGLIMHRARYRYSPTVNADSSSESGRAKNTEDGDRRWKESTFMLPARDWQIALSCNHVQKHVITIESIAADVAAGRAEVLV